jgi:hypothetical protein
MYIHAGVEVGLTLVVASGAAEELAPFACDPLACQQAEPHPFGSTTGTILRGAMRIDFDAHHASRIRFFFRELIDFAFELIGLFTLEAVGMPGFPFFLPEVCHFRSVVR